MSRIDDQILISCLSWISILPLLFLSGSFIQQMDEFQVYCSLKCFMRKQIVNIQTKHEFLRLDKN